MNVYMKDVSHVIIGEDNKVTGKNIYLRGNNLRVNANEVVILNSNSEKKSVKGNNIVRIRSYEVDLDGIDNVLTNPKACITYL